MKRNRIILLTCILCAIAMVFCSCSFQQKNDDIKIEEKSFFSNFKIEDGKVYVYCMLYIDNLTGEEKSIQLKATLENDVENGLLKEALIDGYSIDETTQYFQLQKGENCLEVVFIGEHAGGEQKYDRKLPDIEIIEVE